MYVTEEQRVARFWQQVDRSGCWEWSSPTSMWRETVCRFIPGSVLFLNGLERELNRRGIRTRKRYRNQGSNAYVLPLSGTRQNLLAFASLIYDGSTVALARKQAVLESLCSQSGKERL